MRAWYTPPPIAPAVAAIATMSAAANTLDSETSESAHQLLESTSAVLVAPGGKGKEYNLALTSSMNLMTRLATTNVDVTQSENQQLLLQKALNDTSKDSSSKTAALGVLGSMSQLGAKGVEAAAKVGGIDAILSAVSNEDSSATTAQIAKSSLDQLTKSATDNLSSIDSKSMVQLIEANAIVTDQEKANANQFNKPKEKTQHQNWKDIYSQPTLIDEEEEKPKKPKKPIDPNKVKPKPVGKGARISPKPD
mgnify:CR=1 FL=1